MPAVSMLDELHIRDLGVIEDVTLRLSSGLNVLTGETGAGKTIIVSALELLCGARASAPQVRDGAAVAVVEARLHPVPAAAEDWVDEHDEDLVVARELNVSAGGGRSRARVGGRLASVSALSTVSRAVIEIHGQDDSTRLGQPTAQRDLLDRYGGAPVAEAMAAYRAAYDSYEQARHELEGLRTEQRERVRERDRLQYELDEIDAVDPRPDEEHDLDNRLRLLEHAESLVMAAREAAGLLNHDGGARDALGAAVAGLRTVANVDPGLDDLHQQLERLASDVQQLGLDLSGYADGIAVDPEALELARHRRSALAQLARKYGVDTREICEYAKRARSRVAMLEHDDEREDLLSRELAGLEHDVRAAAARLREARADAANELRYVVASHLNELAMPGARLEIRLTETPPGATGADRVDFLLAANPGEPALELGRFASGGERSRIALALRLALADADDTPVLIFDEVDAGIGGTVARAVGAKLAALARGRQVLCVTHSPQLAAYADAHFLVTKDTAGGRTRSQVAPLDRAARVDELSRMLSGTTDSDVAARHADELLTTARAS
jgi:DNA repair protein RecN (Recombination protein N)